MIVPVRSYNPYQIFVSQVEATLPTNIRIRCESLIMTDTLASCTKVSLHSVALNDRDFYVTNSLEYHDSCVFSRLQKRTEKPDVWTDLNKIRCNMKREKGKISRLYLGWYSQNFWRSFLHGVHYIERCISLLFLQLWQDCHQDILWIPTLVKKRSYLKILWSGGMTRSQPAPWGA